MVLNSLDILDSSDERNIAHTLGTERNREESGLPQGHTHQIKKLGYSARISQMIGSSLPKTCHNNTKKQKCSCDSLYCDVSFIVMFWNQTWSVSKICLWASKVAQWQRTYLQFRRHKRVRFNAWVTSLENPMDRVTGSQRVGHD